MAEAGLIERRPDPTDRRACQIYLTPAAAPHLTAIGQVAASIRAEALRGLDDEHVAIAIAALRTVRANLASR